MAFFKCPHCQAQESSDCKAFQYEDLDAKHQCIACGKHKPVKEWRCECNVIWHTCSKHKFAKAHDYKTPLHSKATNGQSPPHNHHHAKRMKICGQSSLGVMMSVDEHRVRASKRKINEFLESNEKRASRRTVTNVHIELKRKRAHNRNDLIDLGPVIQRTLNPSLCATLKRRIYLGSIPSG